ncbi:MAG: class I SAM-dependent methyltransferase [Candidatus Brocadiales bacterium]|nr:class I SAM-dependent methyltransferase [Candidatus Brocadiales bacterium]
MESREKNLKKIIECLRANNYTKSQILPTEKNYWKLPLEPLNLLNLLFWKRNALFEWSAFPAFYQQLFKIFYPRAFSLFEIFFLNCEAKREEISRFFSEEEINSFIDNNILKEPKGNCKFSIKLIPYKDMILNKGTSWLGKDSVIFAESITKDLNGKTVGKTLDLCTGTGIQAIVSKKYSKRVIASDIREQSIQNAMLNSKINNITDITFLTSDLLNNISGKYDLITANPPYGIVSKNPDDKTYGLHTVFALIENLDNFLNNGGMAKIITESVVKNGKDMVLEKIKQVFNNKDYTIVLTPLNYHVNRPLFKLVHKEYGISHIPLHIITFRKNCKNMIVLLKLSPVKKMICFAYIALMYFKFYLRRR